MLLRWNGQPLQLFSELWYEFQQLIAIMILIYCVKYTLYFRTITFNLQDRKCPLDLKVKIRLEVV